MLQVTSAAPFLLFGILAWAEHQHWLGTGSLPGSMVAAFFAAYGVIAAFAYPAFLAAVPETVGRDRVEHTTAVINAPTNPFAVSPRSWPTRVPMWR